MDYPVIFPLRETLAHRSPDQVRQIARSNYFMQHQADRSPLRNPRRRGFSEIWYKLAGRGYAAVRIDSQGHANLLDDKGRPYEIGGVAAGPHGAVPHYHKEWIAAELLQQYLEDYVPQVVRYDDAGDPVLSLTRPLASLKTAASGVKEDKVKRVHIKQ